MGVVDTFGPNMNVIRRHRSKMRNCARRGMQLEKASAINWLFVQSGQVSNFLLSDPEVMMSNPFLTSGIPESCNPMSLLVRRQSKLKEVFVSDFCSSRFP